MLQLEHFRGECLAQCEDGAAAELGEVDAFRHFFTYFVVGFDFLCFGEFDFLVGVFHFAVGHNDAVAIDFKVACVGIDNDVEVLVAAVDFRQYVAETFLEHAHEGGAVDVFGFFKFFERVNHADRFCFAFRCHCIYFCLVFI